MLVTFPKGIFQSGNFSNVKFPQRQLPKSVLATALAPPYNVLSAALGHPLQPACLRGHILTFRKLPLGKLHIWEVTVNFYSWFIPGYALFFYIHISRGSWRTGNRNLPQPRTGNIIINRKYNYKQEIATFLNLEQEI